MLDKVEGYRKVTYKDIVVLLRSTTELSPIYEKEISDLGIPVYSETSTEYLNSVEIQLIMSCLKIIDNPMQDSEISEEVEENNETNNSLKEKKYISIYNKEKDDYQIYQEEELLDTTKQEVVSENDKIEANNLKEYYASEGESRNNNMGILWITLSIVGVIIILFVIKKRD